MVKLGFDLNKAKNAVKEADRKFLQKQKNIRFQQLMQQSEIDAVICFNPRNTFLFSGFNPILYSHPVVLIMPAEGEPVMLIHALRQSHASDEGAILDIRPYSFWGKIHGIGADAFSALKIICKEKKLFNKNIGYEGSLPISHYQQLIEILHPKSVKDISVMIKQFSMVKNSYERNLLRLSSYLAAEGMKAAIENIRKSEIEASMAAEIAMRQAWVRDLGELEVCGFGDEEGGIPTALWCYATSGYRTAYGCESPNARIPEEGEVSLPVVWAAVGGYHSEIERTVILGKLDLEHTRAYQAMVEARRNVFNVIKDGVTAEEIYNAAATIFDKFEFNEYKPSRIGHGIGLGLHEYPSLSQENSIALREGTVITVEPSFNFDGWGSIRHSDTVIITADGYENLTKDLEEKDMIIR